MRNSLRFEIFRRDNFTCRYCGAKAPDVALNVDHVIPKAKGGTDAPLNLVTACFDCNHGKFTKQLDDPSSLANVEGELDRVAAQRALIEQFLAQNRVLQKEQEKALRQLVKLWDKLTPNRGISLTETDFSRMLAKYPLDVVAEGVRSTAPKVNGYYVRNGVTGAKMYLWGVLRMIVAERDATGTNMALSGHLTPRPPLQDVERGSLAMKDSL